MPPALDLSPQKALAWRIVHRRNIPWLVEHGIPSGNASLRSPQWVDIGNVELIGKRAQHPVREALGGHLGDYVPFYFTPHSVMLCQIQSGWNGIKKRQRDEIVFLVSSVPRLCELGLPFMFSDMHAYRRVARFYQDAADLTKIDWGILRRRDFAHDAEDPVKFDRYQAEVLVKDHVPLDGLLGIGCYDEAVREEIKECVDRGASGLKVVVRPNWYF